MVQGMHVHKYIKKNIGRSKLNPYDVYQCDLPDCKHYIRKELIFGKISLCWNCGNNFEIRPRGTRPFKRKFMCESCWSDKYGKIFKPESQDVEKMLKNMGVIN